MASLVVPFMSRVYFCYSAAKVKILAKDLLVSMRFVMMNV